MTKANFKTSSSLIVAFFLVAASILWDAPGALGRDAVELSQWSESSSREAGTRRTLKVGNVEIGLVWIPAGEFEMGSPTTENGRADVETLHHARLTRGFWALETETTQALYKEVMGINPSKFKGDDLPVETVSWNEATMFCAELTKRLPEGLKASLPTETQWEYACRARTTTAYSYGAAADSGKMNFDSNASKPAKSFAVNRWGLYNMHGNVWEWTSDVYGDYPTDAVDDPQGAANGPYRVMRGGGRGADARDCRSARRLPGAVDLRGENLGFRFALICDEPTSRPEESENATLTAQVAELNDENARLTSENGTLQRDNDALTADKTRLSDQLSEREKEVGRLSSEVDSLTRDRTDFQTQVADLEKQVADLESQLALAVAEAVETAAEAAAAAVDAAADPVETATDSSWAVSTTREGGVRKTLTIKGVEYAFRWIPAGSFMMGSSKREWDLVTATVSWGDGYKETQHRVRISRGFWMLETELTQEMWESVMGENPSYFKGSKRLPVESVSWEDCQKFISKLNELGVCPDGFKFDLPTEAEWEYACRAGTTTAYSFGDALNGDKANCDGNYPFGTDKKGTSLEKTKEVGKYGANAWGLYDMHGNVCEWCSDWYGAYPTGEVTDPTGPKGGAGRVRRGGGWGNGAVGCRAAYRIWSGPGDRYGNLGARLALRSQ